MKFQKKIALCLSIITSMPFFMNTASSFVYAEEKNPIEITSLRSEYEKHFDNGDGTITAFIDTVPLHYYENGEWIEIDNTLIQDEYGNYVNTSNSMDVTLASSASINPLDAIGNEQMVSIDYNGYSISLDLIDDQLITAYSSMEDISNSVSEISINNSEHTESISFSNAELNKKVSDSVDKLESSVSYDSIYNNMNIDINICPSSVKETIILNNYNDIPESFTYYVQSEGLKAVTNNDNGIEFIDENDNVIFTIPPIYMKDSSEIPNVTGNILTTVTDYNDGYLLTLIPDSNWLSDSEIVYPVALYPEVTTNNNAYTYYISESKPDTQYNNNSLYIGGNTSTASRYEAIINSPGLTTNVTDMTLIKKSTFNVYFDPNNRSGTNSPIGIYSIDQKFNYPHWHSCGGDNVSTTLLDTLEFLPNDKGIKSFDITKSSQNLLNYIRTGSYVGSYCYGYKLKAEYDDSRLFRAYSERSSETAPYFEITYSTNSKYSMAYAPHKYNDLGNLNNFQKRMNCYAYALQVYNRDSKSYSLLPGEFGLSNSTSITNNISTLRYYYEGTVYHLDTNQQRLDFIDKNMREDAKALNFTISQPFKKQNGKFVLPSNFNESSGRIIALTTSMYYGLCEYHYYVRNGNGTCSEHGGNCSIWSHKPAHGSVTNKSFSDGTVLCDNNIANYVGDNNGRVYYNSDANYYVITKDTNLYNSWHGNGGSGGTPYRP